MEKKSVSQFYILCVPNGKEEWLVDFNYCVSLMEKKSASQIDIYCVSLMEKKSGSQIFIYFVPLMEKKSGSQIYIYCVPLMEKKSGSQIYIYMCVPNGKEEWLVDFYLFLCP